jgi:hypothetical protein
MPGHGVGGIIVGGGIGEWIDAAPTSQSLVIPRQASEVTRDTRGSECTGKIIIVARRDVGCILASRALSK